MSLKDSSPNDTYINLIMSKPGDRVYSIEECPYVRVDITEAVVNALDGFGPESFIGFEYQIEGNYGNHVTLYTMKDLRESILWEVEQLLDASIVNEKQKAALKNLLSNRINDVFQRKSDTMNLAEQMLK